MERGSHRCIKPSGVTISYDYDKLNNLVRKTAEDETPVAYAYDNMGFRMEMNDDIGEVAYEYDLVGNATKIVQHNGDTVKYEYDVFGRLAEIMYPDGYCTDYEYDLCDRLVKVIGRDDGITTYEYDPDGRVIRCARSNGTETLYSYNPRGQVTALENRRTNNGGALLSSYAYEYDANGFITKETEKVDSYTYTRDYTYDAVGELTGYVEKVNGKPNAEYSYTYDKAGNRTGMVFHDAEYTKFWTDYVYDANNELTRDTYGYYQNKNKIRTIVTNYSYDADGNLVSKTVDEDEIWQYLWTAESRLEAVTKGGTLLMAATYDGDNNRVFQISDASSESKVHEDNQLKKQWTAENNTSFPWEDGNGNGGNGTGHSNTGNGRTNGGMQHNHTGNNSDGLKHINCKQCVDEQEAFVQAMADDTVVIDGVDYLPVGKPNSYKDYELIYYINDVTAENEEVLVEYGANGTPTGTYEYGLQRLSVEYGNEAKEYYLYNATGSVTQTTAQNGSMFLRYTYDPFGNVESIHSPLTVDIDDLNRYTYNAEDYDYNTGLQYLRARYYDTSAGSFISQDTYLGTLVSPLSRNRYTYVNNSPVMYSDPSGHLITALLIIGTVLFVGGTVTSIVADNKQEKAAEAYAAAEESYNSAVEQLDEIGSNISNITNTANSQLAAGQPIDKKQTYADLQAQYAEFGNAYAKMCFSRDEALKQEKKYINAGRWKLVGTGAQVFGSGVLAVGFAPALPAYVDAVAYGGLEIFSNTAMADLLVFGGSVVGGGTVAYGVSEIGEGISGHNFIRDEIYTAFYKAIYKSDDETSIKNAANDAYQRDMEALVLASNLITTLGFAGELSRQSTQPVNSSQPTEKSDTPEVYYRTMSQEDYDYLRMNGEVRATNETFISPTESFSQDYRGVTVKFEVKPGTTSELESIGVRNDAFLSGDNYPDMGLVEKGWAEDYAFFKAEGDQINIGLGRGKALEIFNSNILDFSLSGGQ